MSLKLFLAKETRANERRVALIPDDVKTLVDQGLSVFVEKNAGIEAGYSNKAYEDCGATIVNIEENNLISYKKAFKDINFIVRAKRPSREREKLESQSIPPNTVMLGALDPFEPGSPHIEEYHQTKIQAYSLDQAEVSPDDPMNVLSAMSKIAGMLALRDAIDKSKHKPHKAVIIGLGTVGQSAIDEALKQGLSVSVITGNNSNTDKLKSIGVNAHIVDRSLPIEKQQKQIYSIIKDADIVITSARKSNEKAPILITKPTLESMKPGAVIVDMALSEGGNVEGSKHDETIKVDNGVLITNVSGYPKAMPYEASQLWSKASLTFILRYTEDRKALSINPL